MSDSEKEAANQFPKDEQDQDNFDAQQLFNGIGQDDEKSEQKKPKKLKKLKKQKKSKKQKKQKKKKRRYEEEEEQYGDYDDYDQQQRNSMFDQEAESQSEQDIDEEGDGQAEIGEEEQQNRFKQMINRPSTRDQYYKRFDGKDDRQINALYHRGANRMRENQAMYPGQHDPKIFIVNCKPRHEDELTLNILNKARHLAQTSNKVTIVTVTSLRKKYPGKLFVQAFSEKDVRDSLEGFNLISLGKNLVQLDRQGYVELFNDKFQSKVEYQPLSYVRITKGLYDGDLAQIIKIKANSVDVTVVPRLNVQEVAMKIREQTSKISDQTERKKKMAQLLTLFLNHKSNNFKKRPVKQPVMQEQLKQQFGDNPAVKKIRLSGNPPGLIVLNYKFDQIAKHQGTFKPVQIMPFTPEGNFIGKLNQQKSILTTATSFKKGQEVEIIAGSMAGHWGIIYEIDGNIAVIICKNKELRDQKMSQPIDNICKRFKQGQRVKVISGADTGKTGIVLKVEQKTVQIWTDNQNSIRVNKKNLQVSKAEIICQQNVHNLKKDDLIKTSKNQIGIVLQTTKDNIKILDANNSVQIIGNMDFDSKINTRNIIAKNRTGEQIGPGCMIIIRQGMHQGKRCKVLHVYRQNVFLFHAAITRTSGIAVQNVENCSLISKNEPVQSRNYSAKASQSGLGTSQGSKDQITVGKTITLRTGPLKGYQGIVKSINKDKIEVRVLSKACTEWVPRQNVASKQQTLQIGKTPNRKVGNTHNYVPSPSRY